MTERADRQPDCEQGLGASELQWINSAARIDAELDWIERDNATRADFVPAIDRDMALRAITQIYGLRDSRSSDFAAAYGWMGLWRILGLDFDKSTLVFAESETPKSSQDSQ